MTAATKTRARSSAELRATLGETEDALGEVRGQLAALEAALDRNTARETQVALGEVTAEEVHEERETLLRERHELVEQARRLEAVVATLPGRIGDAEVSEAQTAMRNAEQSRTGAAKERDALAERLRETLHASIAAADALTAARGGYEAADAAYRAAGGQQPHDEPDWRPEGVERLVALILQGPITPAADTERAARRDAAEATRRRDDWLEALAYAVVRGDGWGIPALEKVTPEERPRVDARISALRRELLNDLAEWNQKSRIDTAAALGLPLTDADRARVHADYLASLPAEIAEVLQ